MEKKTNQDHNFIFFSLTKNHEFLRQAKNWVLIVSTKPYMWHVSIGHLFPK